MIFVYDYHDWCLFCFALCCCGCFFFFWVTVPVFSGMYNFLNCSWVQELTQFAANSDRWRQIFYPIYLCSGMSSVPKVNTKVPLLKRELPNDGSRERLGGFMIEAIRADSFSFCSLLASHLCVPFFCFAALVCSVHMNQLIFKSSEFCISVVWDFCSLFTWVLTYCAWRSEEESVISFTSIAF